MGDAEHRQAQALCLLARLGLLSSREAALGWTEQAQSVMRGWRASCWLEGPRDAVTDQDLAGLECEVQRAEMVL